MKQKILRMLYEADDHLSGEELSRTLGISRSAVWKHIHSLQAEGYEIEGVPNKGYRLIKGLGLNPAEIEPYLNTSWLGRNIVFRTEVDSTNILAKKLAEEGAPHGLAVLADTQSAGKGRLGRKWVSEPSSGVWLSSLLRPSVPLAQIPQITLATAVGVAQAVEEIGFTPQIKWPNDVLLDGRKVCGILTEMRGSYENVDWVVVGTGINVNQHKFPEELSEAATSFYLSSGREYPRERVLGALLNHLEAVYEKFFADGFAALRTLWLRYGETVGRFVNVQTPKGVVSGMAVDIDDNGFLLVEQKDGKCVPIMAGDVSLRQMTGACRA